MNYENLTKKELIDLLIQQEHLAKAVEAKDEEISQLTKIVNESKHLAKAVEVKDSEISKKEKEIAYLIQSKAEDIAKVKDNLENARISLQYENQELRDKISKLPMIEKMQEAIKELSEENIRLVSFINRYTDSMENYMKIQQGSLNNIIDLSMILKDSLKNKNIKGEDK